MSFLVFLAIFLILFALGMPVAYTMIVSCGLYAVFNGTNISFLTSEMFHSLNSFILVAIPMFILTAEVMNVSTISDRIFKFANSLVGFIPGGLGHVNIVSSTIFGGMSGSAAADAGGIGYLAYKSMVDKGFDKPFSAAVTASSSTIGAIIPPSVPMIIYAMVANVSIGGLFLGGILPGLLMAVVLMVAVYIISVRRGYPVEQRLTFRGVIKAFTQSFYPLLAPVILLGTILTGVVTVSEAAVVALLYCILLGILLYRSLPLSQFLSSLKKTFITCGAILILFPAGKLFGHVMTVEHIPTYFANFLLSFSDNYYVLLLMINLLFLILGCFSEAIINIILFVPIVWPLMESMGMDPIHFGVMLVFNAMIGVITPPLGGLVFITSAVTKVPIEDIFKAMWPFIIMLLIALLFIALIPQIVTFIPNYFLN